MADPDFAADEEILKGYEDSGDLYGEVEDFISVVTVDQELDPTPVARMLALYATLAAIARKYQRALRAALHCQWCDSEGDGCMVCGSRRRQVRRILEGGEEGR